MTARPKTPALPLKGFDDPWDEAEMVEALDEAERQAGVAFNRAFGKPTQKAVATWRALGVELMIPPGMTAQYQLQMRAPFRPQWLLVSTPGFRIERMELNRQYLLMEDLDADLFLWSTWDRLQNASQLDRVRIGGTDVWDTHAQVTMNVQARPQLVTFRGQLRRFRSMIVGEEFSLRPV